MPAERFDFHNSEGLQLAALLDRPAAPARAIALFAHCFTCGKHNRAARRIADGLKQHGIAVLLFDFTSLGGSEGEFANTTFFSNVHDLVAAADHLRETLAAPSILIGHSLGGAAVLAAAHRVPEARAVVTINAPSDPGHLTDLLADGKAASGDEDKIEVTLGGRQFHVRRAFLDDIAHQNRARPKTKKQRLSADLRVFLLPPKRILVPSQRSAQGGGAADRRQIHLSCRTCWGAKRMTPYREVMRLLHARSSQLDRPMEPCLASLAKAPPEGPDWIHEVKHDGSAARHTALTTVTAARRTSDSTRRA